jgi:hypothetical protein
MMVVDSRVCDGWWWCWQRAPLPGLPTKSGGRDRDGKWKCRRWVTAEDHPVYMFF